MLSDVSHNQTTGHSQAAQEIALLKRSIAVRLGADCLARAADALTLKIEVDLPEMVQQHAIEEVEQILFGGIWQVTESWRIRDAGESDQRDRAVVSAALRRLLDTEFRAAIEAVAPLTQQNPDQLAATLAQASCFAPDQIGFAGQDIAYTFKGQVAVQGATGIIVTMEPGLYLIKALQSLRIVPDDFLAACQRYANLHDLSLHHYQQFGLQKPLAGEQRSLCNLYADTFNQTLQLLEMELLLAHDFLQAPVVQVDQLVDAIMAWGGQHELQVHTTADAATIEQISERIARHQPQAEHAPIHLQVAGARLSHQPSALTDSPMLAMQAPLTLALCQFKVVDQLPGPEATGNLHLRDEICGPYALYDALQRFDQACQQGHPARRKQAQQHIDAMVATIPTRAIDTALDLARQFTADHDIDPSIAAYAITALLTKLAADQSSAAHSPIALGRALLRVLADFDDQPDDNRAHALWLINAGADLSVRTGTGFAAQHLAAQRCDLMDLIPAMQRAGVDLNASAICARGQCQQNTLSIVARLLATSPYFLANQQQTLQYFLDLGCHLPDAPIFFQMEQPIAATPLHFAIAAGSAALGAAVLASMEAHPMARHPSDIDACFLAAGKNQAIDLGLLLIKAGADLDSTGPLDDRQKEPIEAQLSAYYAQHYFHYDIAVASPFERMIRSVRAGRAISKAMATAKVGVAPAPAR